MSSSPPSSFPVERGRLAYRGRSWREAFDALTVSEVEDALSGEDLERVAVSAYLLGREADFVGYLERAHHAHLKADAPLAGARAAFWIGMHLAERGQAGPATGWLGRASRIVEAEGEDCVERGYLRLATAFRHFAGGDPAAACESAREAVRTADRFGDRDLLALALHLEGRALLRQARVAEGLPLLDEAMVAVGSDELSPMVTGIVYCSVISAYRQARALGRAREWTEALASWCERQPDLVAYTSQCRVHRAAILRLRGEWRPSLEEAKRAREGSERDPAGALGAAFYEEGEALRLMGELTAAEEAFRSARGEGREPQPGLALLRLAQGDVEGAAASIRRALAEMSDPLGRARLLPAQVEILLEAGRVDEAGDASGELDRLADEMGTDYLVAAAKHARGAVQLARGDAGAACRSLRETCAEWRSLGAPYHAARSRELLGRACRALGDEDAAGLEIEAARAVYGELDAATDLSRLGSRRPTPAHGLTPREREVLAFVATGRTNRAIAGELFISEKTVARHVSNIFSKLGLSTRAAATAYAYEHDLHHLPT